MTSNDPQLTIPDLYARITRPNDLFLLDVRQPDEFARWRLEASHTPETANIPYQQFFDNEEEAFAQIPTDREIIVLCAWGDTSDFIAARLEEENIHAVNVAGGMLGWSHFHVIRPVCVESDYGIYQVERPSRGCLSYILAGKGEALIIDPSRFIDVYLEFLTAHALTLTAVIDTHAHADHISGAAALAGATGAAYYLHPYDAIHPADLLPAAMPYEYLHNHQTFSPGALTVQTLHTPGHTLGQVCLLAAAPDGRRYLFSGDTLFIDGFGRPDLGSRAEEWAVLTHHSLFSTIHRHIPAETTLLPGHYAHSGEADQNGVYMQTLGKIWQTNNSLQHSAPDEFMAYVLAHLPEHIEAYIEIKRVNLKLSAPDETRLRELETGKNVCALASSD